jgi:transcriptional repressor NrdR
LVHPTIVKQDGRQEPFDRDKLVRGIRKACAGHSIGSGEIENMADWVSDRIQHMETSEIDSQIIGELVLEKLQDTDPVAYLLFASVYLPLPDLYSIRAEIERLQTRHTQSRKETTW